MESRDDVKKIRIGAMEQLGAIPKVLKEPRELVPLLSPANNPEAAATSHAIKIAGEGRKFGL